MSIEPKEQCVVIFNNSICDILSIVKTYFEKKGMTSILLMTDAFYSIVNNSSNEIMNKFFAIMLDNRELKDALLKRDESRASSIIEMLYSSKQKISKFSEYSDLWNNCISVEDKKKITEYITILIKSSDAYGRILVKEAEKK